MAFVNMKKKSLTFFEFEQLLRQAKFQFILKTKQFIYYLPIPYSSFYNENGFIAHNETTGGIDILHYEDVLELTVDGKKISY